MPDIRFIHTADWHIRDTQYGRGFRGDDFTRSVWEVVDQAIELKVDFILNGGDTFQINRPSGPMLALLFAVHQKLKAAGIPMYTVTGNHDMASPSYLHLPDYQGETGDKGGVVCIDNRIVEHEGIRIAGFPGVEWREVLPVIQSWKEPVDIICWHGAVEEFVPFPMDSAWSMVLMPQNAAKAWLLGDIHLPGRQRMENGVLVSYPGPIELCERGEPKRKKIDIYTLPTDWRRMAEFPEPFEYELDTRPVVFLTVNDEKEADQALGVVRAAVLENPGRPPLVFMRYARIMQSAVVRIRELLDLRQTVFRAAASTANYRSPVHRGDGSGRPDLLAVVDQVLPPGNPLNPLSRILANKENNPRFEIKRWVEEQLAPEAALQPAASVAAPAGLDAPPF